MDTNAIIDYLGKKFPLDGMKFMNDIIDNDPTLSVISKIELLSFNTTEEDYQLLLNFVNDSLLLDITNRIVDRSIAIRKSYKTKLPDAIIAGTAIDYDLVLVTRNNSDFKNIGGLKLINPHNNR